MKVFIWFILAFLNFGKILSQGICSQDEILLNATNDFHIHSDSWPRTSRENHNCFMRFKAPNSHDTVAATFMSERSRVRRAPIGFWSSSPTNKVDVFDAFVQDSNRLARIERRSFPLVDIISTYNFLTLKFEINREKDWKFYGIFSVVPPLGCQIVNTTTQTIETPNYPQSITTKAFCEYEIKAPRNQLILIQFKSISIPSSDKCVDDFLEIRDQNNSFRFCDSELPTPFLSSSNTLVVVFDKFTKLPIQLPVQLPVESAFALNYTFVNKSEELYTGLLTNDQTCLPFYKPGRLESTNFIANSQNKYFYKNYCQRLIKAPPNHFIAFYFETFNLEPSVDCRNDYLELREENDTNGTLLIKSCGHLESFSIATSGPEAFLTFWSDNTVNDFGFSIKFNFVEINSNYSEEIEGNLQNVNESSTFWQAFEDCQRMNAELIAIKTRSDQVDIQTLLYQKELYKNDTYIWLGGFRRTRFHYRFGWIDDDNFWEMQYQNWASKEPRKSSNKNCLKISTVSGLWYAEDCDVELPFFCRKRDSEVENELNEEFSTNENSIQEVKTVYIESLNKSENFTMILIVVAMIVVIMVLLQLINEFRFRKVERRYRQYQVSQALINGFAESNL